MLLRICGILSLLLSLSPFSRLSAASKGDAEWQRLLHYQKGYGAAYQSSIDSPDFFMAEDGRNNPESEWTRSLELLKAREFMFQNKVLNPQCLFPARALYFRRAGLIPDAASDCPEYDAFKSQLNLESISLVFSTAYAGNSASMFGHTLLKLNRSGGDAGRSLLDLGVGFLALSDPADGALYALKGLLGGYPGFYTVQNYYELVNQYAYSENRDLWELPIALDPMEREMLAAHLWELTHAASASYYFTHVNCASMLAELIDVAKPAWAVRASLHGFVMPSELMRQVGERLPRTETGFRPSQRRRWLDNLTKLSPEEREDCRRIWALQLLPTKSPGRLVLDTLLDRVTIAKGNLTIDEQKPLRKFEQDLLRARAMLNVASPKVEIVGDNNPLLAHGPTRFELRGGAYDKEFLYGLRLRAGWHDLLDSARGFEPYYHLNYFNFTASKLRSENQLHEADFKLAEVWSLNPWQRDEHLISWTMSGGAQYQNRERSLYFRTSAGISGSRGGLLFSVLPGVTIHGNLSRDRMEAEGFLRLQMLERWTDSFRSLIAVEPTMDDRETKSIMWNLENRFDWTKEIQTNLLIERKNELWKWEIGLARNF
jgi:hypothetical protein